MSRRSRDSLDRRLVQTARTSGSPAARAAAITELLPLARALARRYVRGGEPLEDLEQVACLGLLKAIDGFDLDRDTPFSAYAIPTITGELRRHFRDKGWVIRPPRSIQELSLRADKVRDDAEASAGSVVSHADLADRLGVSTDQLIEAGEARHAMRPASLDRPADAGPDGAGDPLVELLGAVDAGFERVEDAALVRSCLDELSARDRRILELRFGEELTQKEIGARLGVSQMHVSRLLRRILASLSMTALTTVTPNLRTPRTT